MNNLDLGGSTSAVLAESYEEIRTTKTWVTQTTSFTYSPVPIIFTSILPSVATHYDAYDYILVQGMGNLLKYVTQYLI